MLKFKKNNFDFILILKKNIKNENLEFGFCLPHLLSICFPCVRYAPVGFIINSTQG